MAVSKLNKTNNLLQFNARGFAQLIHQRRLQLGLSTRDLATRAKISQPYVVSLERAREAPRSTSIKKRNTSNTPTVDVIAQLAHALDIEPVKLFQQAMHLASRHVLLVVDNSSATPLQIVQHANSDHRHIDIKLRKRNSRLYKPSDITEALYNQLQNLRDEIAGKSLGLVFSQTSSTMTKVDNPNAVIAFEHQWADVVNQAAASVGAHAMFNICAYKISDLKSLKNPLSTARELFDVHEEVWSYQDSRLTIGTNSQKQIIQQLTK